MPGITKATLTAARREGLEDACKAICASCDNMTRKPKATVEKAGMGWEHREPYHPGSGVFVCTCIASKIRDMMTAEDAKAKIANAKPATSKTTPCQGADTEDLTEQGEAADEATA